jgi:sec-independent protein translocase protein TatA
MMDIGIPELIIVLLAVLLLFGPSRIAGLGKELGNGIREFKEGIEGKQVEDLNPTPDPDNQPK